MSAPPPPPPPGGIKRLRRDPERGIVGGVVAGFAELIGTDPLPVRIAFVVGTVLTGGALLIAYALAWALVPTPDGSVGITLPRLARGGGRRTQLGAGVALLVLAALLVFRELGIWWSDALIWPLVLVTGGLALLWGPTRNSAARAAAADEPPLAALRQQATSPVR